jgi:hypothetical protein
MIPKTKSLVHHIPITKARINLGQVVRRVVRNKEYFILEKDGIPVAGIMGADELEDYLELRDPMVKRFIQKSHREYLTGKSRPAPALLAELSRPRSGSSKKAKKRAKA